MGSFDYHYVSSGHDSFEFFGGVDRVHAFDGDDWFTASAFQDHASASHDHGLIAISYTSSDADDVASANSDGFAALETDNNTFYFEAGVEDGYSSFQGGIYKSTLIIAVDSWDSIDTDALAADLAEYDDSNTAFLSQFNVRIEDIDTVVVAVEGAERVSFNTHVGD